MKKIIIVFVCLISVSAFAQDITNTLAPGGKFIVKDTSNNYLTLDQSTGQMNILKTLRLENTTSSTIGVIYKGADRFIHNYYDGVSTNTFVGINTGNFTLTTANANTGIGSTSLFSLTTGDNNTAIGYGSLYSNTTGNSNTANGYNALRLNTTGTFNTAIGTEALYSNTTGNYNTANGLGALYFNTTGYSNTAVSHLSLSSNITGYSNTAVGYLSLSTNTTGYSNTANGTLSLASNTIGFYNSALGLNAGSTITSGSNLTCIGYNAEPTSATATNQITLGNGAINSLRYNTTTITSLSDARDKKNIKELNLGIDFLMKIKPRLFNWDKREWYDDNASDGSKMNEAPTAGFIAQELDEAQTTGNAEWLNLVLKNNPEKWEATPGNLLPIMVKAIQDLKLENEQLKNNNEKLSAEVESLKSMSDKLVALEQLVNELSSVKHAALVTKN